MDGQSFLELSQENEEILFSEIALSDFSDFFDDNHNDFDYKESQISSSNVDEAKTQTGLGDIKPENSNHDNHGANQQDSNKSDQKLKLVARWTRKEVVIKTLESQFTVPVWIRGETSENSKSKSLLSPRTLPILSTSEGSIETNSSRSPTLPDNCICTTCKKSFKDSSTLRKHVLIHGPRTFICPECGKSFVESSKLKRHQLVHTGEKPFECWFDGCGKRFSLDFNLRTHIRIHTGVRPFACPVAGCTKSFVQSTNLKCHIATHYKPKKIGTKNE